MSDTVPVPFTLDELWTIQGGVRHEQGQPWQGLWPTTSVALNDDIAAGIVFCLDSQQEFCTLLLSRGDCFLIDYCISKDLKDATGKPVGRHILTKTFRARQALAYGELPTVDEPDDDGKAARLNTIRKAYE